MSVRTKELKMKTDRVIRAWKDENYRKTLSATEQAQLPAHPSGMIELSDAELGAVSGGLLQNSWSSCPSLHIRCTI